MKIFEHMSFLIFSVPIKIDNYKSYVHPLFDRMMCKTEDSYVLNTDVPFIDYNIETGSIETEDGFEDIVVVENDETDPCAKLYDFLIEKCLISSFNDTVIINADNTTLKDHRNMIMAAGRITLKRELDYIMSNVVPVYDETNLSASWNIPDLFSALTFAIFFSDKNKQQWKICENPACQCVFQTSTTNQRKKYCSTKCCNDASKIRARQQL